jgi:hypothetical protein
MPVLFQYVGGYGWHIGRLLLWPCLLFFGAAATFVIAIAGQIACAIYNWPGVYSLIPPLAVPLTCSVMFAKQIRRKLNGEAFVLNLGSWFDRETTPWLVSRGHRHFRALVMLESVIWGSSILAQLGAAAAPLISQYAR